MIFYSIANLSLVCYFGFFRLKPSKVLQNQFMRPAYFVFFALVASHIGAFAAADDPQANSFINIYTSTCIKHLSNLDELRSKLHALPKLPPEKATAFLNGAPGNAWPVPDKFGTFVIAIPDNKNLCSVYARRLDSISAEERFAKIVSKSPAPLIARAVQDTRSSTQKNGQTHTVSYEWAVPNAQRKMLFTLTTANSESADIQGLATAAYVQ